MNAERIYLDYNATAPLRPAARDAMLRVMERPRNASSVHWFGREARKSLDEARAQILRTSGAEGARAIFVGSGTEANNLVLRGFREVQKVVVSAAEHMSVLKPAQDRQSTVLPVDEQGIVQLDALTQILKNIGGRALVSVMLANNETGVIQPIREIAETVQRLEGFLHCDAAQAFGKIPLDFNELRADMMTLSSHKIGGPQGAAALLLKKGLDLTPILTGGGQEWGLRAGTENMAAIAGFSTAAENISTMSSELRDFMEREIATHAPEAVIFGAKAERLPNTSCIAMPGVPSETQLIAFDLEGVAISSGSACTSGKVERSHVLRAMGVPQEEAGSAIRVSLGAETTRREVERFIAVWKQNYDRANMRRSDLASAA